MARKFLAALALSTSVVLGGCVNPDGSLDVGSTLLAGAGIAAVTVLAVAGSRSHPPRQYAGSYGYRPAYGYSTYGGYRRW
jgi:hypothetical protein